MKDALHSIVSQIVDHPKEIRVEEEDQDGIIQLVIYVKKEDMGKVIGKEGKVIRAIRNVMKIPAMKQNKRINISLAEVIS
ncbi:MAG: KH domain-containing protein [Candidatus Levybacteria bacterium]|nr:KH domain-containing protein [Candidatus Levybacteria bacterium]